MKLWILFLFGCVFAGGLSMRRGREERKPRPVLLLLASAFVAVAFYTQRFT